MPTRLMRLIHWVSLGFRTSPSFPFNALIRENGRVFSPTKKILCAWDPWRSEFPSLRRDRTGIPPGLQVGPIRVRAFQNVPGSFFWVGVHHVAGECRQRMGGHFYCNGIDANGPGRANQSKEVIASGVHVRCRRASRLSIVSLSKSVARWTRRAWSTPLKVCILTTAYRVEAIKQVVIGTTPQARQTWKSAVFVPKR